MKKLVFAAALALAALTQPASAASFNCGRFMCGLFGISCNGLTLALSWADRFTRTTAKPGAVVVQRRSGRSCARMVGSQCVKLGKQGGHVSKIVSLKSSCRAIVRDNRGTYERDICKNLVAYVLPVGG